MTPKTGGMTPPYNTCVISIRKRKIKEAEWSFGTFTFAGGM